MGRSNKSLMNFIGRSIQQPAKGISCLENGGSAAFGFALCLRSRQGHQTLPGNIHKRFRVLSLTDQYTAHHSWANDVSYEQVFAEQLRNFLQPGDIAFGISGKRMLAQRVASSSSRA